MDSVFFSPCFFYHGDFDFTAPLSIECIHEEILAKCLLKEIAIY